MSGQRPRPAVVLGVDINGLGVMRSLYREGVPTIVIATDPQDPGLRSRLPIRAVMAQPGAGGDLDRVILQALAGVDQGRPALIPTSDWFVSFIVRNRGALGERFGLCLPDSAAVEALLDKKRQSELVEALGMPVPRTVHRLETVADDRLEALGLPLIFKPRSFAERKLLGEKNVVVRSAEERAKFLANSAHLLPGLVAQEVIPGGDDCLWVCNCTFDRDHSLVAAFTFRRLRMSPAHYGVTSYAISALNPLIVEMVTELGRALKYVGPAMVEFKFDVRDHSYKFIEINARLGMCNAFDTRCGVNNVLCAYQIAIGERPVPPPGPQRDGVMFLSLADDLHSRRSEGLGLLSSLREYLRHLGQPHVGAYFSWSDPGPAVAVGLREAYRAVPALGRRLLQFPTPGPATSDAQAAVTIGPGRSEEVILKRIHQSPGCRRGG